MCLGGNTNNGAIFLLWNRRHLTKKEAMYFLNKPSDVLREDEVYYMGIPRGFP